MMRLRRGDCVRLLSPASPPEPEAVDQAMLTLEGLGLRVELGRHALDRYHFLAGRDEDRLADLNDALRTPTVRAIVATRGGKGAYRIAHGLDLGAAAADPKPLVGFSENTILHLALWRGAGVPGIHGAPWNRGVHGDLSADSVRHALFSGEDVVVRADPSEPTAALTTAGRAEGVLLGGNLDMIAAAAGWALPSLAGAILLLEDVGKELGHLDRHLTRLIRSGCFHGIAGIAVGQFARCGTSRGLSAVDILRDRLSLLDVPILGGLPLGHGSDAVAVPVGTPAVLDAESQVLRVTPALSPA